MIFTLWWRRGEAEVQGGQGAERVSLCLLCPYYNCYNSAARGVYSGWR